MLCGLRRRAKALCRVLAMLGSAAVRRCQELPIPLCSSSELFASREFRFSILDFSPKKPPGSHRSRVKLQ